MAKKILLVDDDPGAQVVIKPLSSKAGYTVGSETGEQALLLALSDRLGFDHPRPCMPG